MRLEAPRVSKQRPRKRNKLIKKKKKKEREAKETLMGALSKQNKCL